MFTIPHRLSFILTLLLSVLLLTGCGGGGGGSDKIEDTDGDGFPNSVDVDDDNNGLIEITSLEQLDWVRNDLAGASLTDNDGNVDTSGCPADGCHGYELVADLDFDTNGDGVMDANDTYYNNGSGWLPIGDGASPFSADFNGNGYSIRNLYINRPTSDTNTGGVAIGLFGFIDGVGKTITFNNVTLDGSLMSVTGARFTGSFAGGGANAVINNITIDGNINGTADTGGLLGTAFTNVGIENCTTNGTVNGVDITGGLIGSIPPTLGTAGYVNPSITGSQVNSLITGKTYTGVFVGSEYQDGTITNSSATGQDDSDYDSDGVLNGVDVDDDNDGLVEIATLQQLDWMRNDLAGTSLNDGVGNVDSGGCPLGGCHGYELVTDLDFDTNGDGVMDSNDTYYNNGSGWLPIGSGVSPFTADFNGGGHTIHNLYINRSPAYYNGLFGVVDGTSSANIIQNINLESVQVTGYNYTGGLVGRMDSSTISNSSARGAVTGDGDNTGGLVGLVYSSTISNSAASGTVEGSRGYIGGLVGYAVSSPINNSSASGAVTDYDDETGGLVGYVDSSTINNSTASGAVTSSGADTGSLIGYVYRSTISNSSASGAVTSSGGNTGGLGGYVDTSTISNSMASGSVTATTNDSVGGLIGLSFQLTLKNSFATGEVIGNNATGGLIGQVNESSSDPIVHIENSFATGRVTATTGNYVGGLVGLSFQLTLNNTFATGEVVGVKYVGGLIGDANTGTVITDNFATGKVSGTSDLGGLVGWSDGASYSANYFANDKGTANAIGTNHSTPGDINPAGATGATLAELQCPTTANDTTCAASLLYENWDTALWDFGSDMLLPGLIIDGTVYRDGNGDGVLD